MESITKDLKWHRCIISLSLNFSCLKRSIRCIFSSLTSLFSPLILTQANHFSDEGKS